MGLGVMLTKNKRNAKKQVIGHLLGITSLSLLPEKHL
jgi:hypothetical protein